MKKKKTVYYVLIAVSFVALIVSAATFFIPSETIASVLGLPDRTIGQPLERGPMSEDGSFERGAGTDDDLPDRSIMEQVMPILREAQGNITDEVKNKLYDLGLTEEQIELLGKMPGGRPDNGDLQRDGFGRRGIAAGERGIFGIIRGSLLRNLPVIRIGLIVLSVFTISFSAYQILRKKKPYGGM